LVLNVIFRGDLVFKFINLWFNDTAKIIQSQNAEDIFGLFTEVAKCRCSFTINSPDKFNAQVVDYY
jgi:hypothetical protein